MTGVNSPRPPARPGTITLVTRRLGKRLISLACLGAAALVLSGCGSAGPENFETLGNAICANTGRALAAKGELIASGKADGEAKNDVLLSVLQTHQAERNAFDKLRPGIEFEAAWQGLLKYYDDVLLLGKSIITGRDESLAFPPETQDQFHEAMQAFGLEACATRGQEWPGFREPLGGGDIATPPPGTPPTNAKVLPFGVVLNGYTNADDPTAPPQ